MDFYQIEKSASCHDSLRAIESDIQHANMLWVLDISCCFYQFGLHFLRAASISRAKGGACLQIKLVNNHLSPIFLFLLQWLDCSCSCLYPSYLNLIHIVIYKVHLDTKQKFPSHGRKATIRQFYAVILPSLEHLYNASLDMDNYQGKVHGLDLIAKKKSENNCKNLEVDLEREDECGICLEPCTKIALPDCCHEMCINCYRDWNMRSESCPFCRGSLKRVNSGDLWVLPCSGDIVDQESLSKEDVLRFYLYINNLPKDTPDALFLVYYEYLI